MDLNKNIKLLCSAQGITFAQLADRLNVTRQTLYKQSTGAAQLASLERIAAALNVPPFVLLHPAPPAALRQIRTGQVTTASQDQDSTTGQTSPAVLLCPVCKSRLQIQIQGDNTGQEGRPEESADKETAQPDDSKLF